MASSPVQLLDPCLLCYEKVQNFSSLIHHSLYGKYSSSQNFYYTKEVNQILEQALSSNYIQYQDHNFYDNVEQFMKRQYADHEYGKKIQMLSQYYKFHRDLPVWGQRNVDSIMAKHYNKLKDIDYKKIKSVLKKEQGISLTTHKSFSSIDDSQFTKKSRYSTMLHDLEVSQDQLVLRDVCQQMGKALKKVKNQNNFKGTYYSGQKKFEEFLKKQKKRRQNYKINGEANKKSQSLKKIKFNPKFATKCDESQGLKQMNFVSSHSIKQRKYFEKNTLSIEKTTANQTISRQQKKSRRQKSRSSHQTLPRNQISRKNSTARNNIIAELLKPHLKQFNSTNILSKMNSNQNVKTVNEKYRPMEKTRKQKNECDGNRKSLGKEMISRLKIRSNSHHNLPTSMLQRDGSKKQIGSLKVIRNPSKLSIGLSAKRSIEIQNIDDPTNRVSTARESNHKVQRTNSSGKLLNNLQKQYKTNKIVTEKQNKRKSAIEQILQKKLNVFKKKQIVI